MLLPPSRLHARAHPPPYPSSEPHACLLATQMRNAVLAPLLSTPQHPGGYPADRIIWLNDVWFCAQDVWRMAQYKSADMACGLDFDKTYGRRRRRSRQLLQEPDHHLRGTTEGGAGAGHMRQRQVTHDEHPVAGAERDLQAGHNQHPHPQQAQAKHPQQHRAPQQASQAGARDVPSVTRAARSLHGLGDDLHALLSRLAGSPAQQHQQQQHHHHHHHQASDRHLKEFTYVGEDDGPWATYYNTHTSSQQQQRQGGQSGSQQVDASTGAATSGTSAQSLSQSDIKPAAGGANGKWDDGWLDRGRSR
jgi:hypothetical protein